MAKTNYKKAWSKRQAGARLATMVANRWNRYKGRSSSSGAAPYARTAGAFSVLKYYKGLQTKIYRYTVSARPFNLTFNSGTGANFGMAYYDQGTVPGVPGGNGNFIQFGFTLQNLLFQYAGSGITTGAPVANVSEYIAMYEQFKIEAIDFEFYYVNNPNVAGTAVPQVPLVCTCFDPDDMDNFSFSTMQQTPTFRKIQFGNSSGPSNGRQLLKIVPCFSPAIVTVGGANVIPDNKNTWIDTASAAAANYYGVKLYYDNQDGRAAIQYSGFVTVYIKYYVAFRGPK